MKPERIEAGKSYYTVERRKMGNTTMSCDSLSLVDIVAVHNDPPWNPSADVSQNGRVKRWYGSDLAKLREHPPEWLRNPLDGTRCHVCRALKSDGHRDDCQHPRAVAARKRGAR